MTAALALIVAALVAGDRLLTAASPAAEGLMLLLGGIALALACAHGLSRLPSPDALAPAVYYSGERGGLLIAEMSVPHARRAAAKLQREGGDPAVIAALLAHADERERRLS